MPESNTRSSKTVCVIIDPLEPSKRRSPIGGMDTHVKLYFETKDESMKQCVEPESIKTFNGAGTDGDVSEIYNELEEGTEDADKRASDARSGGGRSTGHAGPCGSPFNFPS